MTIIPIGNLSMQATESGSPEFIFELVVQMQAMVLRLAGQFLEESLKTEMDRFLGRGWYKHRRRLKRKEMGVYCSKYRSLQHQDFYRNGHYLRQSAIHWDRVTVNVPQTKCQCGGMCV